MGGIMAVLMKSLDCKYMYFSCGKLDIQNSTVYIETI